MISRVTKGFSTVSHSNSAGRLMLALPSSISGEAAEVVAALRDAGDVACVLFRSAEDGWVDGARIQPFIRAFQDQGIAVLVEDDQRLARAIDTDGVHLTRRGEESSQAFEDRFRDARQALGDDAIIGVTVGLTRHDAMVLGELGASYVALGEPGADAADASDALVSWWAELFEVPCVGWAGTSDVRASELARAGADFVALEMAAGHAVGDLVQAMRGFRRLQERALAA